MLPIWRISSPSWRLGGVGVGLQLLDPRGEVLGLGEQRLLLVALGLRDLLAHRLLLRAQLLELGERGAVRLLGGEDRVDDPLVLTAGALAGADAVGVLTQELDVDHRASLPSGSRGLPGRAGGDNACMLTRRYLLTTSVRAPRRRRLPAPAEPAAGTQPAPTVPVTTSRRARRTTTTARRPPRLRPPPRRRPPGPRRPRRPPGPPATLEALRDELSALSRRHGVDLGVAATETRSKRSFAWGADTTIETASIAKADILATLLLQLQDRGPASRRASWPWPTPDDPAAATTSRPGRCSASRPRRRDDSGQPAVRPADHPVLRLQLGADPHLGPRPAAVRRRARHVGHHVLAARRPLGEVLLDLMEDVIAEQKWGISAAAHGSERVCLKNGWLPRSTLGQRWIVNSIGRITSPSLDLRLAILSQKARPRAGHRGRRAGGRPHPPPSRGLSQSP